MAGIRSKIVVAQRIWGTDAYIAYYDNGDAIMFDSIEEDAVLQRFVQECTTAGCVKTVEFPVQVGTQSRIRCRQTLYCRAMVISGNTGAAGVANNVVSAVTKGGINYIIWSPTFKRLEVHEGLLSSSKPMSLVELDKAPKAATDFMQQCVDTGYTLKRVYQTTVNNKMVTAVEYLFSLKKLPRDFKGSAVDRVNEDELKSMGFLV